jgi:Domain of unknown function (DUF3471)/Domain of unknown function (DUF4440)
MDRTRQSLAVGFLAALACLAGPSPVRAEDKPAPAASEIQRLVRERLDAYARRDAVSWARYVHEDCFCGGSTRAGLQQAITARPASLRNWYGDIRDYTVRVYGSTAVAHYRITEFTAVGDQRLEIEQWRTETYVQQAGTWLLVGGAEAIIPRDPAVAKVDPRLYDGYAGRYEYASGLLDTVTRDGDRLFVQSTGQGKEELWPENDTTYFGKSQDWRVIFVQNAAGAVTSLIFRQNGQDLVARRVQ